MRSKSSSNLAVGVPCRAPLRKQNTGISKALVDYFNSLESEHMEEEEESSFCSKEDLPSDEEMYDEDLTDFAGVESYFYKKVQYGKLLIWTMGDDCNISGKNTQKTKTILQKL